MSDLLPLPPGYTVKAEPAVGYSYFDETGNIVEQHPVDDESIRLLIWRIYEKRQKKGK
jgi:hypothetical protein